MSLRTSWPKAWRCSQSRRRSAWPGRVQDPVGGVDRAGGIPADLFYTAGPITLKYRALGEVAVFLVWGR